MAIVYIMVCLISYLIGGISFSTIFSKKFAGIDIRKKGSKNPGSANVLRSVGKKAAALTLLCDSLKGVIAVLIAIIASKIWDEVDANLLKYLAGVAAVIGHTFPVYYGFKGGKGVATSLGAILALNWKIGLICLIFAIIIIAITKTVSIGAMSSAILYPILTIFIGEVGLVQIVISILLGLFIIYNHRQNIKNIKNGTEGKITSKEY